MFLGIPIGKKETRVKAMGRNVYGIVAGRAKDSDPAIKSLLERIGP